MIHRVILSSLALAGLVEPASAMDLKARLDLEPLIVKHAAANKIPAGLVHRVIIRESRYNARAVGQGGALGLMQIKHATARALGYSGTPEGLLDADTNLTYAVRYLAGAYRVADGDHNRAVGFYARGYYYDAKRRGMLGALAKAPAAEEPVAVVAAPQPEQPQSIFSLLFATPRPPEPAQPAVQTAVEEPETPAKPSKAKRTVKRQATVDPAGQGGAAQGVQGPGAALDAQPATRSGARNSAGAEARQAASKEAVSGQVTAPANGEAAPSARPARRTAASAADRSAQKASARPDGPDTNP